MSPAPPSPPNARSTPLPAGPWIAELRATPARHSLLAAFALLQRSTDLSESTGSPLAPDPVRFTHSADMAFAASELLAVTVDPTDPARHLLLTAGLSPLGPTSPLPLALADELDTPLAHAVLDLFHHRRTLLLCQGLLAADLPALLGGDDPWSRRILALVGLADSPHDPLTALRLAPIFALGDRSPRTLALALRRLIPDLLEDPAISLHCEPIDRHTALAPEQQTRLGRTTARLGDTAALGLAVHLPGSAARLILGPLPAAALERLRPGAPDHTRLCALLADFIPEPLELELVLELARASLPPARLGHCALGRDLWLTPDPHAPHPRRITLPLHPTVPS